MDASTPTLASRDSQKSRGKRRPEPSYSIGTRAVLFTSLVGVYANTLNPTIVGGDSPEFANVACTGGVPHPPGYPLLALLSQAFVWAVPLGSVAWRYVLRMYLMPLVH